ncbi:MAG: hypothetical protein ABW190_05915 [Rhizobacter sp.]
MTTTTSKLKSFSFARMMVLSQRRHEERMAQPPQQQVDAAQREQALRHTLQKMNGTKRLLVFMYPA